MITVAQFTAVINQLLPEPHAGLLAGMVFGTKATLDTTLFDALVTTGTLHIVALSGMNISIITTLVATLLLRFISRRLTSLLTIIIIIGFILFVGPSPSVIRAGIMGSIGLLAVVFGRQLWSLLSLALAVGIMLLLHPLWLGDRSFHLSVLATTGIILFGGKTNSSEKSARRSWKLDTDSRSKTFDHQTSSFQYLSLPSNVSMLTSFIWLLIQDDLRITLAAQALTIPIIFWYFHRISLVSPLTNVLIGWTIFPVTALGFGSAIAGWLWLPLGYVFAWPAWALLEYLVRVVMATSAVPLASVGW